MACRALAFFSVAPNAELVAGFVVKFEMLRRSIVASAAFVDKPVHPVVKIDVAIVGGEFHGMAAGSAENNQNECNSKREFHGLSSVHCCKWTS